MSSIFDMYAELPMPIRKPLWKIWHKVMIRYDQDMKANFMNYGYQGLNGDPQLQLEHRDEHDRYCIQLYDHVANRTTLLNKDVLEVGSGRGGGASYITRYYKPKSYTGIDISDSIIDFCNKYYDVEGLSFKTGIAEKIPFEAGSFDAVINIESARCYSSITTFFKEVFRVLKADGKFLFADMIRPREINTINQKLSDCGFKMIHKTEITPNVVEALNMDHNRRETLIEKLVPGFLIGSFKSFAGTKGTERYNSFSNGTFQYWSFVLEKEQV
ncbi:MAG TPA: class I SAM-dependent methyltransferase [Bacteroidaceae bacterium]|nr:class I SAM-dependent methyltransferase [Bacteroidaceae bacterium]